MENFFTFFLRHKQLFSQTRQRHLRWRHVTVIFLAAQAFNACSPTTAAFATPSVQSDLPLSSVDLIASKTLRVIVKFRQTVPYRDAAFLQDIAQRIHGRIAYISSISLDTHVYQVEPQPGQRQADVLRSLSTLPSVQRVEADALAQPN